MKRLIVTTIVAALVCPALVLASHKKHASPASTNQPNLHGRVVRGTHAVRAKVTVTARGHHHGSHPHVSSAGQFSMHLKPGTYTAWAKRRGAGKGHVSFHIEQGQTMNLTVPIFHHYSLSHRHQTHHLGVASRTAPKPMQTTAQKPTAPKQIITVPTVNQTAGRNSPH